jgi:hypothetical protein
MGCADEDKGYADEGKGCNTEGVSAHGRSYHTFSFDRHLYPNASSAFESSAGGGYAHTDQKVLDQKDPRHKD